MKQVKVIYPSGKIKYYPSKKGKLMRVHAKFTEAEKKDILEACKEYPDCLWKLKGYPVISNFIRIAVLHYLKHQVPLDIKQKQFEMFKKEQEEIAERDAHIKAMRSELEPSEEERQQEDYERLMELQREAVSIDELGEPTEESLEDLSEADTSNNKSNDDVDDEAYSEYYENDEEAEAREKLKEQQQQREQEQEENINA